MKKFLSVVAILLTLGTASVFAKGKAGNAGLGIQGGFAPGAVNYGGAAVTFKLKTVPCVFAVDIGIAGNEVRSAGVTADWWIANPKISGPWGYFYGVGLAAGVHTDGPNFGIGGRAVLGTNVFLIDGFLEFYLDAAWQPMLWFGNWSPKDLLSFPINFGFRFWF